MENFIFCAMHCCGVFIVKFERILRNIQHVNLMPLLIILNMYLSADRNLNIPKITQVSLVQSHQQTLKRQWYYWCCFSKNKFWGPWDSNFIIRFFMKEAEVGFTSFTKRVHHIFYLKITLPLFEASNNTKK